MKNKKIWKRATAGLVFVAVFLSMMYVGRDTKDQKVHAAGLVSTVSLGTSGLSSPSAPQGEKAWAGDYIYYGKYENTPIKWRVLDTSGSAGSSSTSGGILLQADQVLCEKPYVTGTEGKSWSQSDIRNWLQSDFLSTSNFSTSEKNNVMTTSHAAGTSPVSSLQSAALSSDTMFLLDAADLANASYGYALTGKNTNAGIEDYWWLRSSKKDDLSMMGGVAYKRIFQEYATEELGVVPAFNLNRTNILFMTAADAAKNGELKPVSTAEIHEWKFTLSEGETLSTGSVSRSGNELTIPYTYDGSNAGQISAMITNGAYNANGTTVKYYGKISGGVSASGTVKLTLPEDFNEGTDRVYILAEKVNGAKQTDYASELQQLTIPPRHEHSFVWEVDEDDHWRVCTAPGCDLSGQQMDRGEHDFGDNESVTIKEATEQEDGIEQTRCNICGQDILQTVPYDGPDDPDDPDDADDTDDSDEDEEHEYAQRIIKAATCVSTGIKQIYCTDEDCGVSWQEEIPALSATLTHTFGAWKQETAPTTQKEGVSKRTCSVCGATETQAISKLPPVHKHKYNEDVYMSDAKSHWFQCSCGAKSEIDAHEWNKGKVLKKPTKKLTGQIRYVCDYCDRTTVRTIQKLETVFTSGKYQYKVTLGKDGTPCATILGFAKGKSSKTVNIPDTASYKGVKYTVTKIRDKAFASNTKIQNVTMGNKVEAIGKFAFFYATNIKKIRIGTGVKEIGMHAFCHINKLEELKVMSKQLSDPLNDILHGSSILTVIRVPGQKYEKYRKDVFPIYAWKVQKIKK
ncbi:MAG: leucine-rich repeat domain-containing protein [Roseburia sp.]|nr:leucine-rich repeat domain-containing protein [Roseburia sp.]